MPPLIGITLDFETTPTYSKMPWYALRENYCGSVARHGGLPVALPHEVEQIAHYANLLDGLLITGGNFDVPPSYYGEASQHASVTTKDRRTQFEFGITRAMFDLGKPIFGICGGQQLLNVVLGGTLIQHIPDSFENPLAHEQPNPRHEPGHEIEIMQGTLLHRIHGHTQAHINSAHHQAVAKVAPGMVVNAVAPDGVIEGIELPAARFCLGVQWHPEYAVDSVDDKLFAAFVAACGIRKT